MFDKRFSDSPTTLRSTRGCNWNIRTIWIYYCSCLSCKCLFPVHQHFQKQQADLWLCHPPVFKSASRPQRFLWVIIKNGLAILGPSKASNIHLLLMRWPGLSLLPLAKEYIVDVVVKDLMIDPRNVRHIIISPYNILK